MTKDASLFLHGGGERMFHFYCRGFNRGCGNFFGTEGGEFKASLLEGERFGERFSKSRPK
jgi:hypothetical protein